METQNSPEIIPPPLSLGKNKRKQIQKLMNVQRTHIKFDDPIDAPRAIFTKVDLEDNFPYGFGKSKSNKKLFLKAQKSPPPQSQPKSKDYNSMPKLIGMPVVGQLVAYKVLEMSQSYCPEISDFQEASIIAYDMSRSRVTMKRTQPLAVTHNEEGEEEPELRKFELPPDEEWLSDYLAYLAQEAITYDMADILDMRIVA
ncbi:hypothetical protein DFJ77DRAFT_476912 [Powellomyces hirtus]|nr:hypothetical protein DFJ77DRAFT_476912 [Powellomyces hirtus]